MFLETTLTTLTLVVIIHFRNINSVAATNYENVFTAEISRFMLACNFCDDG